MDGPVSPSAEPPTDPVPDRSAAQRAVERALAAWVAVLVLGLFWSLWPSRIPDWRLPTSTGGEVRLRELQGRPLGLLLYTSSSGPPHALREALKLLEHTRNDAHFSVKVVYGAPSVQDTLDLARQHRDLPLLLDPGLRLARDLDLGASAVVLYRPNGRIVDWGRNKYLSARPQSLEALDQKAGLRPLQRRFPTAPEEPKLPYQSLQPLP